MVAPQPTDGMPLTHSIDHIVAPEPTGTLPPRHPKYHLIVGPHSVPFPHLNTRPFFNAPPDTIAPRLISPPYQLGV